MSFWEINSCFCGVQVNIQTQTNCKLWIDVNIVKTNSIHSLSCWLWSCFKSSSLGDKLIPSRILTHSSMKASKQTNKQTNMNKCKYKFVKSNSVHSLSCWLWSCFKSSSPGDIWHHALFFTPSSNLPLLHIRNVYSTSSKN